MEPYIFALLVFTAFAAGFVDSIAGGGGLISVPALMIAGVPPVQAIATNKVQASAASLSAMVAFSRRGFIQWRKEGIALFIVALLGGGAGALLIRFLNQDFLQAFIPILLIAVALYFWFGPKPKVDNQKGRMSVAFFTGTVAPLLAMYDGFFGPGTGSFFMAGLISLCGLGLLPAMGLTKVGNGASNLGSLMIFALSGSILWGLGLAMAVAAFLGAQLGVRAAVKVGAKLVRPLIVFMCVALAIKLLMAA